ncbi:MAG: hypothetical protein QG580_388 [Patescibacteria group bacterium]|jgi:hypothetical protein|nr:hypothetical protein [Patescibacteria group bacterium]
MEKFPTKEEILNFLSSVLENPKISREEKDDRGLYLLDVKSSPNENGEINSYEYLRKGRFDNISSGAIETKIVLVVYGRDGIPVGGDDYAIFDEVTGKFKLI